MSKQVWKFPLGVGHKHVIQMPEGAKFIHAHVAAATPTLWAIVDTEAPLQDHTFLMFETGHDLAELGEYRFNEYVGTVHVGWYVWHIFEVI